VRSGWWLLPQLLGVTLIVTGVLMLSRLPLARSLTGEGRSTADAEAS
jgi:hypothetical protein